MEHMLNRHQLHLFLWVSKQWGYQTVHGTNPVTYDLPIPFEEAPFTVAISTGNSGNHASCGGFTKTTIVLRAGTTAGVWDTVGFFIIGCQLQWGFKEHNNTHQSTVKLPIAFKNSGYVGAANDSGTVTIGIKPTDKQTIELRDNNVGGKTGIYWFVVGQ